MSPAQAANMMEAFTEIMSQFIANNGGDGKKTNDEKHQNF